MLQVRVPIIFFGTPVFSARRDRRYVNVTSSPFRLIAECTVVQYNRTPLQHRAFKLIEQFDLEFPVLHNAEKSLLVLWRPGRAVLF